MKHARGALTPPGFYDNLHQVGKKLTDVYGFIDYQLGAGFDGMAVITRWHSLATAIIYCKGVGGKLRIIKVEGKTISGWQATIDGVEVLFTEKISMPKPNKYIRIADIDRNGEPILNDGEGAVEHNGVFYVIDDQIELQRF